MYSTLNIKFLFSIYLGLWLYFIYHLRIEYIVSFKGLIEPSNIKKEKPTKKEIAVTSIINSVIRLFTTGSEGQIIHMLQKTLEVKDWQRENPNLHKRPTIFIIHKE